MPPQQKETTVMTRKQFYLAVAGFALALAPAAFAQQGNTQGMDMHGKSMGNMNMHGMDMQTMMNHCAQMRQQMKPGAHISADMQRMMTQCDDMQRRMGASSDDAPPATRNR
ncbi:MAG TPA: hypothetical protein VHO91_16310 [Rhodopila sp.]|nr:hypothetical protein [Rhodopila sp.]